jgi:hypothetical protein
MVVEPQVRGVAMTATDEAASAQVERVLNSATMRNAEVLRRLLRFLAEKSLAGEADQLKEYSVGIDVLGKPESYDPRQDSVVRIQIGRLRHKLSDYYLTEGKDDPIVLELPKGHFKLTWQVHPVPAAPVAVSAPAEMPAPETVVFAESAKQPVERRSLPWKQIVAAGVLGLWALTATAFWWKERSFSAPFRATWTPELQELWRPFLQSDRPLILATSAPLFAGFQGGGFYRDQNLNRWEDILASPQVQAIRKILGNPPMQPRYYYTGSGEMASTLQLGKLLNFNGPKISLTRSSQLSWQQMVDNNVVFIGAPRVFGDPYHKLGIDMDLMLRDDGAHDMKAKPGAVEFYPDSYDLVRPADTPERYDDGEIYALISHTPGPLGTGDLQIFASNHSPGVLGAVQWFTHPVFAKEIATRLRQPSGEIAHYYQVLLKVKYRDAVPTEISWITHRLIQPKPAGASR